MTNTNTRPPIPEFPDHPDWEPEIKALLSEGVMELSWHNDACPSVGLIWDDPSIELKIWRDHPDPALSEFGPYAGPGEHMPFMVNAMPWDEKDLPEGIPNAQDGEDFATADVREAVRFFLQCAATLTREHGPARRPGE